MNLMASQITSLTIVYSTVYSGANQRKHQSSASLAFVRGIHRGPVNSPHKWPVTRKMFPFDDVIMNTNHNDQISEHVFFKSTYFQIYFLKWKSLQFGLNFTWRKCFLIDLIDNKSALDQTMAWQRQAIIWTNQWWLNSSRPSDVYIYMIYIYMRQWINHHWLRQWLVAWPTPSYYVNQCWNIVNWTLGAKLQRNLNRNSCILFQENAFENVVWKMVAILIRPQCVNLPTHIYASLSRNVLNLSPIQCIVGPSRKSHYALDKYTLHI